MTFDEATKLARVIPKQSAQSVRTKVGQTNGRYLVHVIQNEVDDKREASFNISTPSEWAVHPLHKHNRKLRAEQVDESVAERFVNEVLDSALSRLTRRARAAVTTS